MHFDNNNSTTNWATVTFHEASPANWLWIQEIFTQILFNERPFLCDFL